MAIINFSRNNKNIFKNLKLQYNKLEGFDTENNIFNDTNFEEIWLDGNILNYSKILTSINPLSDLKVLSLGDC